MSLRLQPGDLVAVIAPSSPLRSVDEGLLEQGVALLESWGLRVRLQLAGQRHLYLAASDEQRAGHLHAVLADPEIRAVFALRGGYGALRLLPRLREHPTPEPKLLVGFSDLTVLHAAAARLWPAVEPVSGPSLATPQLLDDTADAERTRRSLHGSLFDPRHSVVEAVEFLRQGRARGPLWGGCLSMVASLLGGPFPFETPDTILFLEDRAEAPYRVDRLLVQLRNAGTFAAVRGVVFGRMPGCADPYNDLRDVIRDVLADLDVPVAYGLPSGHGAVNLTLRLGSDAELDSARGTFSSA